MGQLVSSKAGRDRGRYYLIFEAVSDRLVKVVDGIVRRVDNPKQKNIKHLSFHPAIAVGVAAKLSHGEKVTNAEIRSAVTELTSKGNKLHEDG
ncbi:MAG: KOW domain-containing RNA-binding protein [Bacillota bacterium]